MSDVKLTYWPTTKIHLDTSKYSEAQKAEQLAQSAGGKKENSDDAIKTRFDISSLGLVKHEESLSGVSKYWSKVPL